MWRKIIKVALALLVIYVASIYVASTEPLGGEAIKILPLGWLKFLIRTLPDVTTNWSGIGMVLLCSGLMVLALQWLMGWLSAAMSTDSSLKWRWRWTFALFASFWLLFGIVMGASGAARHTKWLRQFTEPIYKERISHDLELRMARWALESAWLESKGDFQRTHSLLMSTSYRNDNLGAWERHHFVFFTNASNVIETALIIPRDPEGQRKAGFLVIAKSSSDEPVPIGRLPEFLKR